MTARLMLVMLYRVFIPATHLFEAFKYFALYTAIITVEITCNTGIN